MISLIQKYYIRYGYLLRYGIAGVVGGVVQEGTLYVWVEIFGGEEYYLTGVVLGFLVALVIVFPLQKYWTFRDETTHRTKKQFVIYGAVALGSLFANILLMHLFVETLNIGIYVSQALTIMVVAGTSFLLNRYVTFYEASGVSNSEKIGPLSQ
jgi:putative flippase GtrA